MLMYTIILILLVFTFISAIHLLIFYCTLTIFYSFSIRYFYYYPIYYYYYYIFKLKLEYVNLLCYVVFGNIANNIYEYLIYIIMLSIILVRLRPAFSRWTKSKKLPFKLDKHATPVSLK